MNTNNTMTDKKVKALADWIDDLKKAADNDESFDIAWFKGTENEPLSIIGGWLEGFSEDYSDLLYISKSNSKYAMCIKIANNEGPYLYTDFEMMNMPIDKNGEVDNNCIALERTDNSEELARLYLIEWERLMKEYN